MSRRPVLSAAVATLALAAAALLPGSTASAQEPRKVGAAHEVSAPAMGQGQTAIRIALATRIIDAREAAAGRGPLASAYRRDWIRRLAQLPVEQLVAISGRGPSANLAEQYRQAAAPAAADGISPDIGDSDRDLTYTKVTPCRVADTRVVGSPLANGSSRPFTISGTDDIDFTPQGGHQCGIPYGATAVAINLTVTGTAGNGWLRMYPYGGSGNASVINYAAGSTLANGLVVPICDWMATTCFDDVVVVADAAGTHVIVDVLGYFMAPAKLGSFRTFTSSHMPVGTKDLEDGGACTNYYSASMNVPGPGQILVSAKLRARIEHATGTLSMLQFGVFTSPTACEFATGQDGMVWIPPESPTSLYLVDNTAALTFEVPEAGLYTFYLNGVKYSGAGGSQRFWGGNMTFTYTPE